VDEIMNYRHSEVEYSWAHPEKGVIYIRCGGKRDSSYPNQNGARLWGSHQDISELVGARKEIESKLEQSENEVVRLNKANEEKKKILNNLSEGVAVLCRTPDGNTRVEFISEGFASMMKLSPEKIMEAYREDVRGAVHPDDRELVDNALSDYLNSGKEHIELTYRMKRGDGTYFWVKNSITQMENEGGVRKLYCSHFDLTEEVEQQEKLRKNYRERLDRHLRSAGRNVLLLGQCNITRDAVAEIIDCTDSGLNEKFGSSRTDFITGMSKFITDDDERRGFLGTFLNEAAIRSYRNGFTKLEKICMVKLPKDESGRYVRFFARLLEDPDTGDITGNLSVTDMTEQIIRERIMLNLAYVGYDMVSEIDLNRDKQRIMRNWQSGDFSGEERNYYEYVKSFIENYICEEYREKVSVLLDKKYVVEKLEERGSFSLNYSIKTESGEIRFKNLTVLATNLRLGKICFARKDITETVEQERKSKAELEQALAAAEKASRAKGAFLSSMSHDIRTPMNAIIGFAEIIAQNTGDKETVERSVKKILKSGDVLLKLINDILDLSKIESGKATLDLTAVDLNTEIENLSVMFSESTEQAGVNFVVVKNIANRYVLCDNIKLSQIMVNIISNAVKFTRKGGRIVFSINERGKAENGFAQYVFSVKDTGIGMSENFRSHAFEM
ncbi:MAG: PAS domain-containing sensor histidine kinase, partial [Oscillospiraceae bacterium]